MSVVGTECQSECDVAESAYTAQGPASADVPDFHVALFAAGEALPIGAEGDAEAGLRVGKGEQRFAGVTVPELDVIRDCSQLLAIRVKGDTQDADGVDANRERFFARILLERSGVPGPDRPVLASRSQFVAVRAERHSTDEVRVPPEREGLPAG